MKGQMTVEEFLDILNKEEQLRIIKNDYSNCAVLSLSCKECICKKCLFYHSSRCVYGHCYDDRRATENPYDKAHPEKPPRTMWSNWKKEQAFWCRGGNFYPETDEKACRNFVELEEDSICVKSCIKANVVVFQDGYVSCSLIDCLGCEYCYKELLKIHEKNER